MAENIPIAADHAGFEMKEKLKAELSKLGFHPEDLGAPAEIPGDDYPDYAHPLAREISRGDAKRGILLDRQAKSCRCIRFRLACRRPTLVFASSLRWQVILDLDYSTRLKPGEYGLQRCFRKCPLQRGTRHFAFVLT